MDNEYKKYLKTYFKKQGKWLFLLMIGGIFTNCLNKFTNIPIDFFQQFCWALICFNFFSIRNLEERVTRHYIENFEDKLKAEMEKIFKGKNDKI